MYVCVFVYYGCITSGQLHVKNLISLSLSCFLSFSYNHPNHSDKPDNANNLYLGALWVVSGQPFVKNFLLGSVTRNVVSQAQ